MKRVNHLFDYLISDENLGNAIDEVNATHRWRPRHRPDKTVQRVEADRAGSIEALRTIIVSGFEPSPARKKRRWDKSAGKWRDIYEPKLWPDQYIHHALVQALQRPMMRGMDPYCCGSIRGRGIHYGVRAMKKWHRDDPKGTRWCAQLDIRHFYDSLKPEVVMARMRQLVKDHRVLDLAERVMRDGVMIGAYFSQWFANTTLQPLDHARLLLAGGGLQLGVELLAELLQIDLLQQLLHGLGAHAGLEIVFIFLAHIAVLFFGQDLVLGQRAVAGIGDDIVCKVQDLFENAGADIQKQTHAGRDALEIPDVAARRGQLDVAHALAAHLRAGDILVLVNGEYVVVEKVQHELLESPVKVYNFQVADYHTYYVASGVLVHNMCSYNPPNGGGGKTATVHVDGTDVTFGHGGRHLNGTGLDVSSVNSAIAKDVVGRNLPFTNNVTYYDLRYADKIIHYGAKRIGEAIINVGTYYIK